MQVREGMSDVVLTIGPGPHDSRGRRGDVPPQRRRGRRDRSRRPGPGVITERDILHAIGAGQDPDTELVADHLTSNLTFASPDWSLEQAAAAMVRGGFRHLIVVDGGELVGVLSMRDIVRCWTGDGASCEVPAEAANAWRPWRAGCLELSASGLSGARGVAERSARSTAQEEGLRARRVVGPCCRRALPSNRAILCRGVTGNLQ